MSDYRDKMTLVKVHLWTWEQLDAFHQTNFTPTRYEEFNRCMFDPMARHYGRYFNGYELSTMTPQQIIDATNERSKGGFTCPRALLRAYGKELMDAFTDSKLSSADEIDLWSSDDLYLAVKDHPRLKEPIQPSTFLLLKKAGITGYEMRTQDLDVLQARCDSLASEPPIPPDHLALIKDTVALKWCIRPPPIHEKDDEYKKNRPEKRCSTSLSDGHGKTTTTDGGRGTRQRSRKNPEVDSKQMTVVTTTTSGSGGGSMATESEKDSRAQLKWLDKRSTAYTFAGYRKGEYKRMLEDHATMVKIDAAFFLREFGIRLGHQQAAKKQTGSIQAGAIGNGAMCIVGGTSDESFIMNGLEVRASTYRWLCPVARFYADEDELRHVAATCLFEFIGVREVVGEITTYLVWTANPAPERCVPFLPRICFSTSVYLRRENMKGYKWSTIGNRDPVSGKRWMASVCGTNKTSWTSVSGRGTLLIQPANNETVTDKEIIFIVNYMEHVDLTRFPAISIDDVAYDMSRLEWF
jgi:hypothetical protein